MKVLGAEKKKIREMTFIETREPENLKPLTKAALGKFQNIIINENDEITKGGQFMDSIAPSTLSLILKVMKMI